jgi:ABC-type spermidine/putrescine transport system permease subunit I
MAAAGEFRPIDRIAERMAEHPRLLFLLQIVPTLTFVAFFVFVPVASIFLWSFWRVEEARFVPEFTLEAYAQLFGIGYSNFMVLILLQTLRIAVTQALIALVIGFTIAYYVGIKMRGNKYALPLLLLFAIPFLTSYLLRTLSWWLPLQNRGLINIILMGLGLIDEPLPLLFSEFAVHVGLLSTYLPFMIFPIWLAMSRIDETVLAASADLGGRPHDTLFRVVIPLVLPGMLIGGVFVFVGVLGDSVVPLLLGGPGNSLIAQQIDAAVAGQRWNVAGAVASVILVIAFALIFAWEKFFGLRRIGEI